MVVYEVESESCGAKIINQTVDEAVEMVMLEAEESDATIPKGFEATVREKIAALAPGEYAHFEDGEEDYFGVRVTALEMTQEELDNIPEFEGC